MSEAYQQLFDNTCPHCTDDRIEYDQDANLTKGVGRPCIAQIWRCKVCLKTFFIYERYVWVAEWEPEK